MHYIQKIIFMTDSELMTHEEDEPVLAGEGDLDGVLWIIICMTQEGSKPLLGAWYLQSDMAFKQIVGFYEFELAAVDWISNTSMWLCSSLRNILRIYRYHPLLCFCDLTDRCGTWTDKLKELILEKLSNGTTFTQCQWKGCRVWSYCGHWINMGDKPKVCFMPRVSSEQWLMLLCVKVLASTFKH